MSIQTQELIEMKFIAKVSAMGPRRFMVEIPKERFNEAKELKGKHVFVMLKEIIVDEAFDKE